MKFEMLPQTVSELARNYPATSDIYNRVRRLLTRPKMERKILRPPRIGSATLVKPQAEFDVLFEAMNTVVCSERDVRRSNGYFIPTQALQREVTAETTRYPQNNAINLERSGRCFSHEIEYVLQLPSLSYGFNFY